MNSTTWTFPVVQTEEELNAYLDGLLQWVNNDNTEPFVYSEQEKDPPKCECGATAANYPWHSDWCPLHEKP